MGSQMQKFLDKEKLEMNRDQLRRYNSGIKQVDNERLRNYFLEYSKEIDDGKAIQNVFEFIQWIIANK